MCWQQALFFPRGIFNRVGVKRESIHCCDPHAYDPADCPECGKAHLISKLTGKRLG